MMTMLEATIINLAEELLAEVMSFCRLANEHATTDYDHRDYDQAQGALSSLLVLAHKPDCGMSPDATRALLEIEDRVAVASAEGRVLLIGPAIAVD